MFKGKGLRDIKGALEKWEKTYILPEYLTKCGYDRVSRDFQQLLENKDVDEVADLEASVSRQRFDEYSSAIARAVREKLPFESDSESMNKLFEYASDSGGGGFQYGPVTIQVAPDPDWCGLYLHWDIEPYSWRLDVMHGGLSDGSPRTYETFSDALAGIKAYSLPWVERDVRKALLEDDERWAKFLGGR